MNLIKFIFILMTIPLLYGQPISTPKTIKPLVELGPIDEQSQATFIGIEGTTSYKTAKLYNITKDNIIFERKDLFEFPLSETSTSFFSGGHKADITGEGLPELVLLITNPQTGTQIISFTIKPGLKFERLHAPYFIKSKQKASEAVSSQVATIYEDKDKEIIICFGSPDRKAVIVDYSGELNTKTIGKNFLENNVGPIILRIADQNNDDISDIYILSNGKIKEEKTYYAPQFNFSPTKKLEIQDSIKDVYFIPRSNQTPQKIILLKNEKLYIEEWNKYFPTKTTGLQTIVKHEGTDIFILDQRGNIVRFNINNSEKEITKTKTISAQFKTANFNQIEHLVLKNNHIIITHDNEPEIIIQNLNEKPTPTKKQALISEKTNPENKQNNTQKTEEEKKDKAKKTTTTQDTLYINVKERTEININLDPKKQFVSLEKILGPPKMNLNKEKLAFIWEPQEEDVGYNVLKYTTTYNTTDEYEVYIEKGVDKLKPKQELITTEKNLTIYVNAKPTIKISPPTTQTVQANHEIIIPIYINDLNSEQPLSLDMEPASLKNTKIEDRKFYWIPQNENFGPNKINFIVNDGILSDTAQVEVIVDTIKTTKTLKKQLITTVNKEFIHSLPTTKTTTTEILKAPENLRITQEKEIHWIPTTPQLGENFITIEIKEEEETYLYNLSVFVNAPPIISYRPDNIEYINLNEVFQFTLRSFEENENQKHFWELQNSPENMKLENTTITWNANIPDYHLYEIVLSDTIDVDKFSGYIYVNDIPQIISMPPHYIQLGDTLQYNIIIKDANMFSPDNKETPNDIIYFLKTAPQKMMLTENKLEWIPEKTETGAHQIEIEAYDGLEKAEQNFTLFVNDVPTITSTDYLKIAVGEELHHFVNAQDKNDLTKLTYGINSNVDDMLMNAKTGEILWTPKEEDLGQHTIEVSVSDGFDLSGDVQTITIFVYKNPTFLEAVLPEAYAGVEYNHKIKAQDMFNKNIPGIDVFIKLKESNLKEISFNTHTHNLQIIPTYEELGTQYVTFSLNDNHENKIEESFPIKVLSSPCETSDTLYIEQEEVVNKTQKIDKSVIYTSKNERLNLVSTSPAKPDTIFITKYDTTITNITDSIFVTINEPQKYKKENEKLSKRQRKRAERKAAKQLRKNKKTVEKQSHAEEKKTEPLIITTQHKNINIINKETVVIEQVILPEENQKGKKEIPKSKPKEKKPKPDLGHNINGIKTPLNDKMKQHQFGQKGITKTQKTEPTKPDFLNQSMYWTTQKQ